MPHLRDTVPAAPPDTSAFGAGDYAIVGEITVEGNRKTRREIVAREMSLRPGDTLWLEQLDATFLRQRQLLLNTGLFSQAELRLDALDTAVHTTGVRAIVRERWYLYPSASVDLADRNFNVWWTEQNADLGRVNVGFKVRHRNFSGRADRLALSVQSGYTSKAEAVYTVPYVDRARVIGLEMGYLVDRNREWAFRTVGGIQTFYGSDTAAVLRRRRYRIGITLRPGIYVNHLLQFERQVTRADSALALEGNPDFFGDGRLRQGFSGLLYQVTYDRRDVRRFPLAGAYARFGLHKRGLGAGDDLNRLDTWLSVARYQPLGSSAFNLALEGKAKVDVVRTPVPYFSRVSLGFGDDFLRGYQFYVVDGLDYAFAKATLRARVFDQSLRMPFLPLKMMQVVPVRVFAGVHYDVGGARDPFDTPGNVLANRVLSGYGVGLYANAWYGQVFVLEYSRNEFGDWGWYLGFSLGG